MADLIELILNKLSLRTRVFHQGMHCGNWKLNLEQSDKVLFHFVSQGQCLVENPEQGLNVNLSKGDLLLFIRPGQHVLRAVDDCPESDDIDEKTESAESQNDGLVCAYVEFDRNMHNPLFDALPDVVVSRVAAQPNPSWIENLLGLMFAEAGAQTTASQTVIERLTDILFIHVIRVYLSDSAVDKGVLAAYNDPGLRAVLELMHESPQKPWTIADFAETASLSRSAFIDKFSRILEVPPMTYLTRQRLEYAYQKLLRGGSKMIDIALDCGYENESSFSKAFKREYGMSPSAVVRNF
ncbi:MAG: AraC family transcriptional regulator [Gammaproteobacteria bacterium]|nr:AraC family transcriptional regulator [Gammaproteobacteria bacterium]